VALSASSSARDRWISFLTVVNVAEIVLACAAGLGAAGLEVAVDAPPVLAGTARRVSALDLSRLELSLTQAGLDPPSRVQIRLIPEDAPVARETPTWIVGQAFGVQDIVIFPARISSYPYDSLESVVRHEIVHLALSARAGRGALPRWFHEGVAEAVGSGWGFTGQLRLLWATAQSPALSEVMALFESDGQPGTAQAYLLAVALVDDIRRRHGLDVPGAIAGRVGQGIPFERAFEMEIGESVSTATARAWSSYQGPSSWLPLLTSSQVIWAAILALAFAALVVRLRRRAEQRRSWDE
jgi:hypothetical protein